jgi:hypothetical protein
MFKAFEKYCRLPGGGYAGIADVENGAQVERLDKMETFWLSETLSESGCADVVFHCWTDVIYVRIEYFYLLFSDGQTVPLDQNVFNTEVSQIDGWSLYVGRGADARSLVAGAHITHLYTQERVQIRQFGLIPFSGYTTMMCNADYRHAYSIKSKILTKMRFYLADQFSGTSGTPRMLFSYRFTFDPLIEQ